MSEFIFHPEAVKDLEEIWEYIAAENLEAADRVLDEIYDTIKSLVPFPLSVTHVLISPRDLCASRLFATT